MRCKDVDFVTKNIHLLVTIESFRYCARAEVTAIFLIAMIYASGAGRLYCHVGAERGGSA